MTNYEKMKAAKEEMYEIGRSTNAVAMEYKVAFAEKQSDLHRDLTLSPQGRLHKLEEFKKQQGAKFIKQATEMRNAYDRAATEAHLAAELFLNEPGNKPNEIGVQSFERKLAEFETALLLATNPDKAMELVRQFASDTQDPYLAGKLREKMPSVIREVTTIAAGKAPLYKAHLSSVLDSINHSATAGGYLEAQQTLDAGSLVGTDIWRKGGGQLNAIQQAVGSEFTMFANKPEKFGQELPKYGGSE